MNCLGPGHSNRKVTKIAKHLVKFREYMSLPVELLEQLPLQSLCPWNLLSCMKCFFIVIVSNLNTNAMLHSYEPDTDAILVSQCCVYEETWLFLFPGKRKSEGQQKEP